MVKSEVVDAGGGIGVEVPVGEAPKKAAAKKVPAKTSAPAKKTPAKKTAPVKGAAKKTAAPKEKKERAPREPKLLGKPQTAILTVLAKHPDGLTRTQISEKTEIKSGFSSLLGHLEPEKREPQSLAARGLIKIVTEEEGTVHKITADGKKILDKVLKG
jgi:hypothetical protein